MTLSISHPEPGARLGADQCPGTGRRGHGLTMAVIHDTGCCREWETGQASTPDRAQSFQQAAARWATAWPQHRQHRAAAAEASRAAAEAEPEAGPGTEPQSVRDARDKHLQAQREADHEHEAEAS